jgi:hypothetical protein
MANFMLPLSGPVNQSWNWFSRATGTQFGLININLGKSSNPELEQEILDDVGTYGRQIGQLGDALEAVLNHMNTGEWEPEAQQAVKALRYQLDEVRRLKNKHSKQQSG